MNTLAGLGVLITRPTAQAAGLQAHVALLGGRPVLFPALDILPVDDAAGPTQYDLAACDLAIFVSPSAVQFGLARFSSWPACLPAAGVGQGTAAALRAAGVTAVLAPDVGADSEHLLGLPQLQAMAGRRVCIFRGDGGRELLADTLRSRGASVDYIPCYRRGLGSADPAPLREIWRRGDIHAVTVLSTQTLDNLFTLLGAGDAGLIRATPLFAPHARITGHARDLGVELCIVTAPGELGLVRGLVEYFTHG